MNALEMPRNRLQQKEQLLREFFDMTSRSDRQQLDNYKERILAYYRGQRDYINQRELDPQLKNIYQILEIVRLNPRNARDFETACALALPIYTRLEQSAHWDFYDLRIMSVVISKHQQLKVAFQMLERCEQELDNHADVEQASHLRMLIYANLSARILRGRFEDEELSPEELKAKFHQVTDQAIGLCLARQAYPFAKALQVRKALADGDTEQLIALMQNLRGLATTEFYKDVEAEVRSYRSLLKMPVR